MATLLIQLNGAPDDEVAELRELLSSHAIDFYETEAGRWGISVAAFWLRDESQREQAHALIRDYQQARSARMRTAYEEQRQAGRHETLLSRLYTAPLRTLLYLLLIAIILYFSLMPFIGKL